MEFYLLKAWTMKRKYLTKKQFKQLSKHVVKRVKTIRPLPVKIEGSSLGDFRFIEQMPRKNVQYLIGYESGIILFDRATCSTVLKKQGEEFSLRAVVFYKDIFVSFTEEYTLIFRNFEVIWQSKQFISHGRNKYAHLCEGQLYFVEWNNNLLHINLDELLIKIEKGTSKNSDYKIYDRNVKDVAVHNNAQEVTYMKTDGKGVTSLYCAKKRVCIAFTEGATFSCISKYDKYVVLGGFKKDRANGTTEGILELFTCTGSKLNFYRYKLTHPHEDRVSVIRMFKCFGHVFAASLRFHKFLDLFAIYRDTLVCMVTIPTIDPNTTLKDWHRDIKVAFKSACHSEITIVADKELLSITLKA